MCGKSTEEYYSHSGSWPDKGQSEPQGILQVTQFSNTLSEILFVKKKNNCVKIITLITERQAASAVGGVGRLFEVSFWDTGGDLSLL